MKKLFFVVAAMFCVVAASAQEKMIEVSQLPQTAKTFISTHYKSDKVTIATAERKEYKVLFESGTKVEFDAKGEWKEVENKRKVAIPNAIVPANIAKMVKAKFPKNIIVTIEKDGKFVDVELDNGVELKFNSKGELVELDS